MNGSQVWMCGRSIYSNSPIHSEMFDAIGYLLSLPATEIVLRETLINRDSML